MKYGELVKKWNKLDRKDRVVKIIQKVYLFSLHFVESNAN